MDAGEEGLDGWVGTVLQDSFRLTRLVGSGAMGRVYEGSLLRLDKRVAVKVLARDLAGNQEALARFRREADVTSRLGHPHIIQVFDFGTTPAGEPYMVMEYLEGEDLEQRLRRVDRLSLPAAVSVVKQVASALSSTHAKGIVHRDLKPANIFVLELEGESELYVKVLDFGISKVKAAPVRLTAQSSFMGTPNYVSPEQARGLTDEIDHLSDQWSLACITYQLLAGRGPFVGGSWHTLLTKVVYDEPPALSSLISEVPAAIDSVLRRALSKQKGDRYPTIGAFARAFCAAASPPPPRAASAAPLRRRFPTTALLIAGAGLALPLALATTMLRRTSARARPAQAAPAAPR
jgi:serine/threonine protein kinase